MKQHNLFLSVILVSLACVGGFGCRPSANAGTSADIAPYIPSSPVAVPNSGGGDAPGQWGAFNEVLSSGGIYKNTSGKYLKLTFAPLGDSMDAIFADAPSGSVTVTDADGDRTTGTFSLERDRTLTVSLPSGKKKKRVYELSADGTKLSDIGGKETLTKQP